MQPISSPNTPPDSAPPPHLQALAHKLSQKIQESVELLSQGSDLDKIAQSLKELDTLSQQAQNA